MVLLNFDRNKKVKKRVASAVASKYEPAKQNSNESKKSQSLEEKAKE